MYAVDILKVESMNTQLVFNLGRWLAHSASTLECLNVTQIADLLLYAFLGHLCQNAPKKKFLLIPCANLC